MSDREALFKRADELGIEYQKNTPTITLENWIADAEAVQDAALEPEFQAADNESTGDDQEPAVDPMAAVNQPVETLNKPIPPPVEMTVDEKNEARAASLSKSPGATMRPEQLYRKEIQRRKAKAMEKFVVTITNRDNRENDHANAAYLGFENQHFSLSRIVPLDIPIELERCLIKQAEACTMTLHKAEIKNGKRTGNSTPVTVKKYTVSYQNSQTQTA